MQLIVSAAAEAAAASGEQKQPAVVICTAFRQCSLTLLLTSCLPVPRRLDSVGDSRADRRAWKLDENLLVRVTHGQTDVQATRLKSEQASA